MNNRRPFLSLRFRCLLRAFFLLLTATCVQSAAFAQSATASLSGTVEDINGAFIPGAAITLLNNYTSLKRETTTNDEGSFSMLLLPPGTYSLTTRREGFAAARIPDITLNVGDQKSVRIQLKTGDVVAEVQVTNEASLISESSAVGTVVDRQFVDNIPLNGRSFQSLITLTPGVVLSRADNLSAGQFSVNGQRPSGNSFMIDGVSANIGTFPGGATAAQVGGNLPGLTTAGTTQSLVAVDALQEFSVQTSTYSAEFGRQPGGQISISTRRGENKFHGSVFDYIRNEVFDANNWFANRSGQARPPLRQNDFGGTFGGPVFFPRFGEGGRTLYSGKDKTFFFFSYEGLRLRQPKFALTNVPTLCLRGAGSCPVGQSAAPAALQPILKAFPLPNGRDLGIGLAEFASSYSDSSTLDATSIRIDHTVNSKVNLFGRYNQAPSESAERFILGLARVVSNRINTKTLTVGFTASVTSSVINDLRVNFSDNYGVRSSSLDTFRGAIPVDRNVVIPSQYDNGGEASLSFSIPGNTSVPILGFDAPFVGSQRQLNILDTLSFNTGNHQFKFGFDYRRLSPTIDGSNYRISATFNSTQQVMNAAPSSTSIGSNLPTKPRFTNLSVYGQDNWRLSARLTLNLGLRWELNPAPGEADGNLPIAVTQIKDLSTMQLAPRGTPLWKTTYNNFAPRFGAAYQLFQTPGRETVVRGGFGLYYDTGTDQAAAQSVAFPFFASRTITNPPVTFPLNPVQVAPPVIPASQPSIATPYALLNAIDPEAKLPYTWEWNFALEQSLGKSQSLSISYVGAAGRQLVQRKLLTLTSINPRFTQVQLMTNSATSDYHSMQAQFRRRLSRGLQALASYTWAHAIDDDSATNTNRVAKRGNANFDLRHNFASAITYDIPSPKGLGFAKAIFNRWSIDTTMHIQSALPFDIVATTLIDPATGATSNVRPNVIEGVPFYLDGSQYPGGRIFNNTPPTAAQITAAGCRPVTASTPAKGAFCTPQVGQSGTLGRNEMRGRPASQIDLALRREFRFFEGLRLQFRAEAFNVFNHPNFGQINTTLASPTFGEPTNMLGQQLGGISQLYQIGGPRSLQFAVKVLF